MAKESQLTLKDRFRYQSALLLKEAINKEIKDVFKTALNCIEIRFGTDFEGFEALRAQILRSGNDAMRNIGRIIDDKFIIEKQKEVVTIKFKARNELNKGEANGNT